jgi:hypothetical protein
VPLASARSLVEIAEREPLLADLTAAWLAERPQDAAGFAAVPGEAVDDVLASSARRALPRSDPLEPVHLVPFPTLRVNAGVAYGLQRKTASRRPSQNPCY